MIISTCLTYNGKFVVKWTIVEVDESNSGLTFQEIFEHMKIGLVEGIQPWPWPIVVEMCDQIEAIDVTIDTISVGKNKESLMPCSPTLEACKTCSVFGNFVKFSIKIQHPENCICSCRPTEKNVINAFEIMMEAARTIQSREGNNLPDPIEPKNQLDKLNNSIIELLKSKNLGWDSTRHFSFVYKLGKILWYIDGQHATLESRTKKLPDIFRALSGYNRPELSKHRKRTIENLKSSILKSHVYTLQEFLGTTWIDQPAWIDVKVDYTMV